MTKENKKRKQHKTNKKQHNNKVFSEEGGTPATFVITEPTSLLTEYKHVVILRVHVFGFLDHFPASFRAADAFEFQSVQTSMNKAWAVLVPTAPPPPPVPLVPIPGGSSLVPDFS